MKYDEIIKTAKTKPTTVFFDLDGVLVDVNYSPDGVKDNKGMFINSRPIQTVIKVADKMHKAGVIIGILSLCNYNHQKEEKFEWLAKHMPFIKKENIIIIPKKEENVPQMEKRFLKSTYLKGRIKEGEVFYFVEDTIENLRGMTKELSSVHCVHVSSFIL